MKRTLIAAFLVLLVGCGQKSPSSGAAGVVVENGAFTCLPTDIVEAINDMVESDESGILLGLSDYEESGKAISSDNLGRLLVTLEENNNGNLTSVRVYWDSNSNNENVITTAGAYCSLLFEMLSPENADDIYDGVSGVISRGSGEVKYTSNGVVVAFQSLQGRNWLDIDASEET